MKKVLSSVAIGSLLLSFMACEKKQQDPPPTVTTQTFSDQSSTDNSQGEYIATTVNGIVDDAARSAGGVNKTLDCNKPTQIVTTDPKFYKIITLDYGTGCVDGSKTKKGKIIIYVTKPRDQVDSRDSLVFENFYINNYGISGTFYRTMKGTTNITYNGNTFAYPTSYGDCYFITITDSATKKSFTWNSLRRRDYKIPDPNNYLDGYFEISGQTYGKNMAGNNYTSNIKSPLVLKNCTSLGWTLVKGVIYYETKDASQKVLNTLEIDYGAGDCDNIIYASVNGGAKIEGKLQ